MRVICPKHETCETWCYHQTDHEWDKECNWDFNGCPKCVEVQSTKWFRIVSDGDGHKYLIPNEHYEAFDDWLDHYEEHGGDADWTGFDFEACRLNGPVNMVLFRDYRLEG
jgi:hypothetical protein